MYMSHNVRAMDKDATLSDTETVNVRISVSKTKSNSMAVWLSPRLSAGLSRQ